MSSISIAKTFAVVVSIKDASVVRQNLAVHNLLPEKSRPFLHEGSGEKQLVILTNLSTKRDQSGATSNSESPWNRLMTLLEELHTSSQLGQFQIVEVPQVKLNAAETLNPLHRAVHEWLIASSQRTGTEDIWALLADLPSSYSIYEPMLLLPPGTFSGLSWRQLLQGQAQDEVPSTLAEFLAGSLGVSHIAIDAPIPLKTTTVDDTSENIIRSPLHLKPLYGDFGPLLPPYPRHCPDQADFDNAMWVSTRQNGINQVWAPLYTMFSSGNVTEKARILRLKSVEDAIDVGIKSGAGSCAVDLFAGIGYFAFSYAKAGVSTVLCWDLNPWSIEGMRRGCERNGWTYQIAGGLSTNTTHLEKVNQLTDLPNFLIFCEINSRATEWITQNRSKLPPVCHVNCGMLPTIGLAWKIACQILDPRLGGFIHWHETVHEAILLQRQSELLHTLQTYIHAHGAEAQTQVRLVDIAKVKSVAPRLVHYCFDFWVPPKQETNDIRH